ncbi:MAG: hypothetical protein A3C85_01625 [Candidatus Doudnabacteria bacterium RIFCSPHIGHO2_02_FULL_48_21]|uniref:Uncharacterized protein n=1 Tax=Candidatus Doudnabacteria bacterium RIFCSPLOWO2_02_FULL_48_13 TaxID=1817845 RepID=A0A1F5QCX4_9BACT|nr:MAG: hypothetical protein A3K05_02590 [Candidatus Doudnabacteria bacterium RIFCSPHIGHO2_01_48_18]OGE77479.1 MAG: hypothetical protein A2668_04330 [Candidatus Doudnabacteria bacterium RIFCSPHIGHO2_01_FULL_48_180]OGE91542.1 MAG: hypothetical protein A3F44_03910 [Candidatus Doudnabacteria bacterium RIFCSPHIGHO2_12_FULL_47_25]OGE93132.1 MAG: hypothetical protein A3C85_01625 [Candidatus Doudnabacteria bacterium RIFCSPHIGHO2_02_FULL_48_21]OGE97270.1 MAG: hypothetical protein A3A83_01515 [Candidatu
MACALEALGNQFLVFLAGTSALAAKDLGVRRHKPAQELGVLVINIRDFTLAEDTVFRNWI